MKTFKIVLSVAIAITGCFYLYDGDYSKAIIAAFLLYLNTSDGIISITYSDRDCDDWTSVDKLLPEENTMVLAFLGNCNIRMMHHMGEGRFAEPWKGGIIEVTHWMELPAQPKRTKTK